VLRTLYGYLTRDLIKVTLLALVVVTLLMTVLAILQPLRKYGLAGMQALKLFLFTLPAMLSFTLPVAGLFAATLIYGRFSQDNELLASRASGVSTLSLMRPALGLGAVVTVLSLALGNFIAPDLSSIAAMIRSDVREFIYQPLKRRGYIELRREGSRHIIHADVVDAEHDTLRGVVYAYVRDPKQPRGPDEKPRPGGMFLASAAAAYLDFYRDAAGRSRLVVQPIAPSITRVGETVGPAQAPESESLRFVVPLDPPVKEKPSWYNWEKLIETHRDPSRHPEINGRLEQIKQWVCSDLLSDTIIEAIDATRRYDKFRLGDEVYVLGAASASKDADGGAVLTGAPPGEDGPPVTVTVLRRGHKIETLTAARGRVNIAWSQFAERAHVTLKLDGEVTSVTEGIDGGSRRRMAEWNRGEIPVPADVRERTERIRLGDLYRNPKQFSRSEKVERHVEYLLDKRITHLRNALVAEMNARVAYGLSCFLLVAMGAALGVIYRGGQVISAFALSAIPASIITALILMGKGMVRNPAVRPEYGLACIWGGIAALLVADAVIYMRLARR